MGATLSATPRLNDEFRFNYTNNGATQSSSLDNFGGAVPVTLSQMTAGYSGPGPKLAAVIFALPGTGIIGGGIRLGDNVHSSQRQINIVDNVSLLKGAHHLRFGVDWRHLTPTFAPWAYGQFAIFFSEANVISGTADDVTINANKGVRPIYNNFAAYAEDTWHLSPRLTLDVGLRWELNPAPHDANGLKPVVVTGITGSDVSGAALGPPSAPFYKTFYTAFAPRVGVAYQLNTTPGRETVVRGGLGIYYDLGSGEATAAWSGFPFQASNDLGSVPFPLSPAQAVAPAFPSAPTLPIASPIIAQNPGLKLPLTLQWNIALQQSLGVKQAVTLSYVASAARRLLVTQAINQPPHDPYTFPRPNPNFSDIYSVLSGRRL